MTLRLRTIGLALSAIAAVPVAGLAAAGPASAAATDCTVGQLCHWSGLNYTGAMATLTPSHLEDDSSFPRSLSVVNNTNRDVTISLNTWTCVSSTGAVLANLDARCVASTRPLTLAVRQNLLPGEQWTPAIDLASIGAGQADWVLAAASEQTSLPS